MLLLFGFTSCTTVTTPATGIVTITLNIIDIAPMMRADLERPLNNYYIYMDNTYQGTMTSSGALTITDVAFGEHTFEARDYLIAGISLKNSIDAKKQKELRLPESQLACYGSITCKVNLSVNYVTIPVHCDLLIAVE